MISKEEVLQLAALARLKVSESEVVALQEDISNILDYVGQVSAQGSTLDQGSTRSNLNTLHTVMSDDVPRENDDTLANKRESLLKALPKREGDFALVRKIIQKDAE